MIATPEEEQGSFIFSSLDHFSRPYFAQQNLMVASRINCGDLTLQSCQGAVQDGNSGFWGLGNNGTKTHAKPIGILRAT